MRAEERLTNCSEATSLSLGLRQAKPAAGTRLWRPTRVPSPGGSWTTAWPEDEVLRHRHARICHPPQTLHFGTAFCQNSSILTSSGPSFFSPGLAGMARSLLAFLQELRKRLWRQGDKPGSQQYENKMPSCSLPKDFRLHVPHICWSFTWWIASLLGWYIDLKKILARKCVWGQTDQWK